jgi:hypothetical protein
MYTLIFDFNDTISPSNFIQVIGEYEDKIGTSAISFIERYVNAGLLSEKTVIRPPGSGMRPKILKCQTIKRKHGQNPTHIKKHII